MVKAFYPQSLAEALGIRAAESVIPFAGGTDLMVKFRTAPGAPPDFKKPILYLGHLPELRGVNKIPGGLRILPCTTLAELLQEDNIPLPFKSALEEIAGPGIRNLGTLGGNLCNASPAGDTLPFLYACDAVLELSSLQGKRTVPVEDFILAPGKTSLGEEELLTAVTFPVPVFKEWTYRKIGTRRADALSKISFFAFTSQAHKKPRIALGACAPRVIRSRQAEKEIYERITKRDSWNFPELKVLGEEYYGKLISPIDDQRSTAFYRREVSLRLIAEFLYKTYMQTREEQ